MQKIGRAEQENKRAQHPKYNRTEQEKSRAEKCIKIGPSGKADSPILIKASFDYKKRSLSNARVASASALT